MTVLFSVKRRTALTKLQGFYETRIADTPDCAGPLIDLVEADVIQLPDPATNPKGSVLTGDHWDAVESKRISAAFQQITNFIAERENVHV